MGEIVAQSELILRRPDWKRNGRTVVLATGAFDLLHPGHIRLLEQARAHGDLLVVALQNDAAVKAATPAPATLATVAAHPRPVNPAPERAEVLAAIAAVDYVTILDSESPSAFVAQLEPDVIVEGHASPPQASASEFPPGPVARHETSPRIVRVPLEPGYSTTSLLDRIQQLRWQTPPRQPNA